MITVYSFVIITVSAMNNFGVGPIAS